MNEERKKEIDRYKLQMAQFEVTLRNLTTRAQVLDALWENAVNEGNGKEESIFRAEMMAVYDTVFDIRIDMQGAIRHINAL